MLRYAGTSDEEAKRLAAAGGVAPLDLYMVKNRHGRVNTDDPVQLGFDRSFGSLAERGRSPHRAF